MQAHPSLGALAAGTLFANALVELGDAEAEAAAGADGLAHLEALLAVVAADVDLLVLLAHCVRVCFLLFCRRSREGRDWSSKGFRRVLGK